MRSAETAVEAGPGFRAREWALVFLSVLLCKQAFSMAEASQLQWLLWPLSMLLNATGTLSFQMTPSGEWWDARHGLVIVKACAGTNFLLASWLGYLWTWRTRPLGLSLVLRASGAAWLTTLAANGVRILLIAHGQEDLARLTGLDDRETHRLIGVVVYFVCLGLQMGGSRALAAATMLYLGVTLVLPVAHAWVLGLQFPAAAHLAWTAAIPLAIGAGYAIVRSVGMRWRRERITQVP